MKTVAKSSVPDLTIFGGTALTMNPKGEILENAVIEITHGRISAIKTQDKGSAPKGKSIDARGCLVLPGFINGHTHAGMTLLRGVADDLPLHRWLNEAIFPLEKKWGNQDFVYLGTLLATVEMVRTGTTTFNDMYYFEEAAAKAIHESGMRAICGQTIVEISGVEKQEAVFEKFDQFLSKISSFPRVMGGIAPHSIYGVSDTTWRQVIEFAEKRNLTIHTHLSETQEEMDQVQKTMGKTPTQYFDEIGLWKQRVVAAHACCVTEKDIEILGKYKVGIVHNPDSNLKLGTKICPVVELRKAGANLSLGTDGTASNNNLDLIQEADTAAKIQSYRKGAGSLTSEDTVKLLTIEGARALGLANDIGSLEIGKSADIVAVDVTGAHATPLYNPYSHLVYSASGHDVKHSIVGGAVLMEDRKLTQVDEKEILAESRAWGKKIRP